MVQQVITMDCETLPCEAGFEENLYWETEEEYRKTALDGNLGRLLCIVYTRDFSDGRRLEFGCHGWNEDSGRFDDEAATLRSFWEMMRGFNPGRDLIVGHNVMEFDLPFIIKRSIINGVRPTVRLSFAKYRCQPIYDTMREWDCWAYKNYTGLEKLAYVLGIPSPKEGDVTGANLYEAYLDGRYEEIYRYCMQDVKATRAVYRRMNFLGTAAPAISIGKVSAIS